MIFYFNRDGSLIFQTPSVVVQGSSDSNKIVMVAPFENISTVSVAFNLPNGVNTPKYLLTLDTETGLNGIIDRRGNRFYVWSRILPVGVTKQAGACKCQFYATNNQGVIKATNTVEFTVDSGVSSITPPENIYEDIITYISQTFTTIKDTKQIIDLMGTTAPTSSTVGEVGQKYFDKTTSKFYACVSANPTVGEYVWEEISGAGGTFDYSDLLNKPKINGVTLEGDKSTQDLGLSSVPSGGNKDQVLSKKTNNSFEFEWKDPTKVEDNTHSEPFKAIVRLSQAEYDTLVTQGTVTLASGKVITYSPYDTVYITPTESFNASEYYKKTQTYSKTEVDDLLPQIIY